MYKEKSVLQQGKAFKRRFFIVRIGVILLLCGRRIDHCIERTIAFIHTMVGWYPITEEANNGS
jgi:hypothetical protein